MGRTNETQTAAALRTALTLRDLTDPEQGEHAMQHVVDAIVERLVVAWRSAVLVHRASPLVTVADNYDRLGYPPDGAARDARYTRYVGADTLLRTQTSAALPGLLTTLSVARIDDVLLCCPGLVYRRDRIDRLHCGEPHQVDLWRIRDGTALTTADLDDMVAQVVAAALPCSTQWRTSPARHPYTEHGRQIDVRVGPAWVEVGECGLAHPDVLARCGLPPSVTGLAMGLGLDRLLMLRKGIGDIRLLRSDDPRVSAQMSDLSPYRPVSRQPPVRRDLSVAVEAGATMEDLGATIREALGPDHHSIESIDLVSTTPYDVLPSNARTRMGMQPHHDNVLLRLTIRSLERTLTRADANTLRDRVYAHLHQGVIGETLSPRSKRRTAEHRPKRATSPPHRDRSR